MGITPHLPHFAKNKCSKYPHNIPVAHTSAETYVRNIAYFANSNKPTRRTLRMGKPREINAKLSRIVSWERYPVNNLDNTHTHRKMEHESQNGGYDGGGTPLSPHWARPVARVLLHPLCAWSTDKFHSDDGGLGAVIPRIDIKGAPLHPWTRPLPCKPWLVRRGPGLRT